MKVLFVHPRGNNWLGDMKDISQIFNIMPPHGMMSIAAFLEQRGIETAFIDCYAKPLPVEEVVAEIVRQGADLIGFSCTTSSFLEGYRIAERLKERLPRVPIVFGGAHACSIGATLLDGFPAIDFLVIGEGENSTTDYTDCTDGNRGGKLWI